MKIQKEIIHIFYKGKLFLNSDQKISITENSNQFYSSIKFILNFSQNEAIPSPLKTSKLIKKDFQNFFEGKSQFEESIIYAFISKRKKIQEIGLNIQESIKLGKIINFEQLITNSDFKHLIEEENIINFIYESFISMSFTAIEKVVNNELRHNYNDGLFYGEVEEYRYQNIVLVKINDINGITLETAKRLNKFTRYFYKTNSLTKVIIPLTAIIRYSETCCFLSSTLLPISRKSKINLI